LVSVTGRGSVNVLPLPYNNSHPASPARNVLNLVGNVTSKEEIFPMERNTLDGARRKPSVSAGKRPLLTPKLHSQQPHPLQHVDSKEGANL
jgi:hypothetical protein